MIFSILHLAQRKFAIGFQFSNMVPRPQLTLMQRSSLVKWRWQGKSWWQIQQEFQIHFPQARMPSRATVYNLVNKFSREATLHNLNTMRSGRLKTVTTQANIDLVRGLLENERNLAVGHFRSSARRNPLYIKKSSFNYITKVKLKFKPYVLAKYARLTERAKQMRVIMCQFLIRQPRHYFARLLISDEAIFYLNGHVFNRRTNVCYAPAHQGRPENFFQKVCNHLKEQWFS